MIQSNIKKIMRAKKMTIQELAAQTGLAVETIQRTRRDKRPDQFAACRLTTLEAIAKSLDVKIKDLFEEL